MYVYAFSMRVSVSVRKSEHFFFLYRVHIPKIMHTQLSLFLSIFYFELGYGESRNNESTDSLPLFFKDSTSHLFSLKKTKT